MVMKMKMKIKQGSLGMEGEALARKVKSGDPESWERDGRAGINLTISMLWAIFLGSQPAWRL